MAQAKTRQPQGPATGKSQASAKANRAKAKPAATRPVKPLRTLNKTKTHRVRNFICAVIAFIFALAALLGTVTHILPEELQALPYMPIVVSLVPWFTLLAVIALVCAIVSKRTVSIVMAVLAIALQAFWQYPFFYQPSKLPRAAVAAAQRVRVEPFSKTRAMFLRRSRSPRTPEARRFFRATARSIISIICSSDRSSRDRRERLFNSGLKVIMTKLETSGKISFFVKPCILSQVLIMAQTVKVVMLIPPLDVGA